MQKNLISVGEAFLLVHNIKCRSSFADILVLQKRINRIRNMEKWPQVLVANRSEDEIDRNVSKAEGQRLANEFGCTFFEVSRGSSNWIEATSFALVRAIRLQEDQKAPPQSASLPTVPKRGDRVMVASLQSQSCKVMIIATIDHCCDRISSNNLLEYGFLT